MEEEINIADAGLVITAPYLPQLFRIMELTADSKFKDERSAEQAVRLLQLAANGCCNSPQPSLALHKLMCGLDTGHAIPTEIEPGRRDKEELVEAMLKAIIRNWKSIGNTSIDGLRETFLQRNGTLRLVDYKWHLKVEQSSMDILLDALPWDFSIIKFPWMNRAIHVEWI